MPRNSSGVYSLPAGNPVVSGTTITVSWGNTTLSDIGSAITDSLSRDGEGGMNAPLLLDLGTVSLPGLAFVGDPDTGTYRDQADSQTLVAGGVAGWTVRSSTVFPGSSSVQMLFRAGTVTDPGLCPFGDQNTGFYQDTPDQIAISLGGVTAGQIAQGSFTGTLTGYASGPTGTVSYQRVGNIVSMWVSSSINGTSNAVTLTMTGLPTIIRPASLKDVPCNIQDDTLALHSALARIDSTGVITFAIGTVVAARLHFNPNSFTPSGTKGVPAAWSVTYSVA